MTLYSSFAWRACIVAFVSFSRALFADQDWDGDNALGNFSYTDNWYGDTQPGWGSGNGDLTLHFNNGHATSIYYDYNHFVTTSNIFFASTFPTSISWDGNGNGINFNQKLENDGSATVTIGSVILSGAKNGASHIELNPVAGDLVLNITNGFLNDNSVPYQVWGNGGHTLTINRPLGVGTSAANVNFTIAQNSNVLFADAQLFAGQTFVLNGKLQFTSNGNVNGSIVRLGDTTGTNSAEIDLLTTTGGVNLSSTINPRSGSSGTLQIDSQNGSGMNTLSGHIATDKNFTINQALGGELDVTQGRSSATSTGTGFDLRTSTVTFTGEGNFVIGGGSPTGFGTIYDSGSGANGSVIMAGFGSLSLNDANSYRGGTTIRSGTLFIGANNALGSGNGTVGGGTPPAVLLGDSTGSSDASLLTSGAFTITNVVTLHQGNTGTLTLGGNTAAASIYSGSIFLGSRGIHPSKDGTFVAGTGGSVDFSEVINENTNNTTVGNVTIGNATHSGTVKFSNAANAYGGTTTITNGAILEVVSLGTGTSNSSIGNSARGTASNLVLSNGTLKYTGAGETTTRSFTFDANGGTLDASAGGNGALTLTGAAVASGTGNRTLTLTGTGANALQTVIGDPSSGTTALTKNGTGTWQLTGTSANTYTGATIVNGGMLNVAANGALGSTSSVTVNSGGTLILSNSSATNRINDSAEIVLASGTLARSGSGNMHEGVAASTSDGGATHTGASGAGLGALTLISSSTLDFGSDGIGMVAFASFIPNGSVLNILNWTSNAHGPNGVSGVSGADDRLVFATNQSDNLANFTFAGGISAMQIALGDGFFEIVPVPEPETWLGALLTLAALAGKQRRKIALLFKRRCGRSARIPSLHP